MAFTNAIVKKVALANANCEVKNIASCQLDLYTHVYHKIVEVAIFDLILF